MFGSASLVTTRNHLAGFNLEQDTFILQSDGSIGLCKIIFDSNGAVFEVTRNEVGSGDDIIQTWVPKSDLCNETKNQGRPTKSRIKFSTKTEMFSISSDSSIIKTKHVNPKKTVILATHEFDNIMVLISDKKYQIFDLDTNEEYLGQTSISKCTSSIAAWNKYLTPKKMLSDVDIVYCDGQKVYHSVSGKEREVDAGKCLALCKTQYGFLASFETNWSLSPMQFFKDDVINLENLEIPINHTSSNEARLQFYSVEMNCIDDHPLPAHSEPALLAVHADIDLIGVSGFYTPLVSIFMISNYAFVHVKDISLGCSMRTVGLTFRGNTLLALKRKFDVDKVNLAFPSKSKLVTGDLSLDVLNLESHIKCRSDLPDKIPRFAREALFEQFKSRIFDIGRDMAIPSDKDNLFVIQPSGKEILDQTNDFIKAERKNSSHRYDINITEEEITQKSKEIMEDYKKYQPMSDAELSDDTIQFLKDCRRREPFKPIPVPSTSESDGEDKEKPSLDQSEMIDPELLIFPNMSDLTASVTQLVVSVSSGSSEDEVHARSKKTVKRRRSVSKSDNIQGTKNEQKLDRIIELLERQNDLLEKIVDSQFITNKQ